MSQPIEPTPVLRGEREIRRFEEKIEADLKRPAALTPTPKLEKAREMVHKYAVK
jgi:hypothetical protein